MLTVAGILVAPSAATAQVSPRPTVDVRAFGAVGNGATNDTAAIQRANDAVAGLGGGVVTFSPGIYVAAGIKQDSNVEFSGLQQASLKHPDGVTNTNIVEGRVFRTKGTISKGSNKLPVTNTRGIVPGAVIAVRGAGGASSVQITTLASTLKKGVQSLLLTQPAAWAKNGTNFVLIEQEILSYTNILGSTATSLKRALFGTVEVDHPKGASVSQLQALYARVVSVRSGSIELNRVAVQTVRSADVFVGSTGMTVRALTFDGSRVPGGSSSTNPFPLEYSYARRVQILDCTIRNGDHGGIMLDQGTSDSTIARNVLEDHGTADTGAGVWLFRGASGNVVRDNTIRGNNYYGIAIDDRSVSSTEWDAKSNANRALSNRIDIPSTGANSAIFIAGGDHNQILQNKLVSAQTGVSIIRSTQGLRAQDSVSNDIADNTLMGHPRGIHVSGSNNRFVRNVFTSVAVQVVDSGVGNAYS